MTQLRKMMLEELQRRNYSQATVRAYLHAVEAFAKYFHTQPDRLGLEHIRTWQAHLFHDKKLSANTVTVSHDCRPVRFFCLQDAAASTIQWTRFLTRRDPVAFPRSSHRMRLPG